MKVQLTDHDLAEFRKKLPAAIVTKTGSNEYDISGIPDKLIREHIPPIIEEEKEKNDALSLLKKAQDTEFEAMGIIAKKAVQETWAEARQQISKSAKELSDAVLSAKMQMDNAIKKQNEEMQKAIIAAQEQIEHLKQTQDANIRNAIEKFQTQLTELEKRQNQDEENFKKLLSEPANKLEKIITALKSVGD